ncbi:MarR family winged helix-turn-helix transcriptional regulator [Celeribacter litoreus]|uniref:MarR family winged helix-turn-helix transcriptional regulator n=1 Tax=Celeribacter litoreus TaxID=2876714 RepID=UPI001CCD745D|nr:MarR family winged helix-turn-helix transcriptional regulator [Celeribacter litoreus]MCA0043516.1 MarR family winged helix-turn-helix transcriptional regulator [Celeribacter litoreus]
MTKSDPKSSPAVSDPEAGFELETFLPFLLNRAAEVTSQAFQPAYREGFGLTRSQWRVLAITGHYGAITARDICTIAHEEKSKISRAVSALTESGHLQKALGETDKRTEVLSLTEKGTTLFETLGQSALQFDRTLRAAFTPEKEAQFRALLSDLEAALAECSNQEDI